MATQVGTQRHAKPNYKGRDKDDVIPPLGHFQEEWIRACKGDLKTHCDFDYGGTVIETMLLGLVAYRVGKKINYDGKNGRVTNSAEANGLLIGQRNGH